MSELPTIQSGPILGVFSCLRGLVAHEFFRPSKLLTAFKPILKAHLKIYKKGEGKKHLAWH